MQRPRPIVTFTTDFGLADAYVAEMKAAVLRQCPDATLVDVTHLIPPQDVLAGSIALERAVRSFPAGTIHVAVVDPGVGTDRTLLLARTGTDQIILAPNNGLITWLWRCMPDVYFSELLWRPSGETSNTFHGRDIIAPAAGLLAAEAFPPDGIGRLRNLVQLDVHQAYQLTDALVLHVDHYGNCTSNLPAHLLTPDSTILGGLPLSRTYADVASGEPLALIGSSGLLEIAVRNGSAATQLNLKVGDKIEIR